MVNRGRGHRRRPELPRHRSIFGSVPSHRVTGNVSVGLGLAVLACGHSAYRPTAEVPSLCYGSLASDESSTQSPRLVDERTPAARDEVDTSTATRVESSGAGKSHAPFEPGAERATLLGVSIANWDASETIRVRVPATAIVSGAELTSSALGPCHRGARPQQQRRGADGTTFEVTFERGSIDAQSALDLRIDGNCERLPIGQLSVRYDREAQPLVTVGFSGAFQRVEHSNALTLLRLGIGYFAGPVRLDVSGLFGVTTCPEQTCGLNTRGGGERLHNGLAYGTTVDLRWLDLTHSTTDGPFLWGFGLGGRYLFARATVPLETGVAQRSFHGAFIVPSFAMSDAVDDAFRADVEKNIGLFVNVPVGMLVDVTSRERGFSAGVDFEFQLPL